MVEVPSLFKLCIDGIKKEILLGDDLLPYIYELPSDLFDCLLTHLPPLALQKLQEELCVNFETAWRTLYQLRWSGLVRRIETLDRYSKQGGADLQLTSDWQQMYWEMHLQNCLDEATGIALLPSFRGGLGEIKISDAIVELIGDEGYTGHSSCDYSKLSYHCQKFGFYARKLRLQNVLCTAETCHLLRNSKLEGLELRWIKSKDHVEGLCKLLNQNRETLKTLEFIHCKLSSSFVDEICDSLQIKGDLDPHGIEHFSIKTSSLIETNPFALPVGLASFLSAGRSLSLLSFCDNHLGKKFAEMLFNTLLDASSSISILDLSENNIAGWLFHFKWRSSSCSNLSLGIGNSLQSLRVLNLRGNNLRKDDAESLKYALVHVPNLEILDLSDNPIEDDGLRSLIPYFAEMTETQSCFTNLALEDCGLSFNGVNQLLRVLSTLKNPLNTLSIGDNDLGSNVGASLGKFLGTGIRELDIEDIGLGSSGFLGVQEEMMEDLKLVHINISKNRGGGEVAKFLSKLVSYAPDLVAINAGYNFMPSESLPMIFSALKVAKGKLERLDLTGNTCCDQPIDDSVLAEFQINGKPVVILPSLPALNAAYDDDP